MEYSQVLENARKNIGPNCKACPVCNGLACGNTMPGPGSKAPGNGANDNFKAWRNIRLNMDTLVEGSVTDTSSFFLGREFSFPLITAPIGSLKYQYNLSDDITDYNEKCMAACESRGIMHAFGNGLEQRTLGKGIASSQAHSNCGFPIFNPDPQEDLFNMIDSYSHGTLPLFSGLVIDSAGLPHLKKLHGKGGTKSIEDLRSFKEHCHTPVIIKGIMTAKSAIKAVEAGADAIIVSNHGGRVLPETPGTAEVLPEIADAVKGKTKIIVDGGIRYGSDMFKALALGADMCMICRPVLVSYYGGGKEGIECYFDKIKAELSDTMYMCGAHKISEISKEMVRISR